MTPLKNRARTGLRKALQVYPAPLRALRSVVQPRSTHLFCIGAPKTGTLSVANIFSPAFRSRHEPYCDQGADMLEARWNGQLTDRAAARWLHQKDAILWLDCEAFHVMAWFSDLLSREFEEAKFILTVRDCYSWLDSIINQHINGKSVGPAFMKMRSLYHGNGGAPEAPVLEEYGLYSLEGYLSYWARHNDFVLDSVPADRLMVLPVKRLSSHLNHIAAFSGVEASQLNGESAHSHKAPRKHNVLGRMERGMVLEKIQELCGPTIDRLKEYEYVQGYDLVGKG